MKWSIATNLLAAVLFLFSIPSDAMSASGEIEALKITPEVIEELTAQSEHGDVNSQYWLGTAYEFGYSVPVNVERAIDLYTRAATGNNDKAQFRLGELYMHANSTTRDYTKAHYWYTKSASEGNNHAQAALGFMYQNGLGVTSDLSTAVKWYEKSSAQGNPHAQNQLGIMYLNGEGVAKDPTLAAKYLLMAARGGYDVAQKNYAELILYGIGVTKDYDAAAEWYQTAAAQGNSEAASRLAMMEARGLWSKQDQRDKTATIRRISAFPELSCSADAAKRIEVRARHILIFVIPNDNINGTKTTQDDLITAYEKAEHARRDLIKGDSFEDVLARYSSKKSIQERLVGDVGFFKKGTMVSQFEKAAFCLPVNEYSPVFRTDFGFHVIQVTGVRK